MPINQHSGGAWQRGKDLYVKHNSVWKNAIEGHVNNASSWQRFHVAEDTVTLNSNASIIEVASLFASNEWSGPKTKRLIIPNGVTVSGSSSAPALKISSGWSSLLTIENHGIIQGRGGAANGGTGGDALVNSIANNIVLENYGTIRSGGGGGGRGGDGGGGVYYTTVNQGPLYSFYSPESFVYHSGSSGGPSYNSNWAWNGQLVGTTITNNNSSLVNGIYTYKIGGIANQSFASDGNSQYAQHTWYYISRSFQQANYTSGGVGGAGGRGHGSNGVLANGLSGTSGGTNAGAGGTGGKGGSWGQSGSAGAKGANGNNGNGGNGSAAGLAGFAYKGQFNITGNGSILGRT